MENAERDQNRVTTLIAVSSVDGITPVKLYADPVTHRLLVDVTGPGASPLTTKGDLYTFTTTNARLPLGTDGQVLVVDSSTPSGLKWQTAGAGTGDVVGPASSTDNAIARFDSTTGKLIQNSGVTISDANVISAAGLIDSSLTASQILATNGSKQLVSLDTATYPTLAQLAFVKGVTSAIQTQLDGKQATGNYITDLTGDATASGPGSVAITLATVNSNVGSFGSATQAVVFTVNAKGLVTAASATTITPAIGSVTGLGTGVATFLTTPSSANLAAALTDKTGTGIAVFATSPTLVTPVLGVATATSINGLTITTSTGALTIANGKTATFSNTITIAGTDSTVMTFPSSSATIARTDAGQTFTGVNTFTSPKILTDISDTNGNELIKFTSVASAVNEITITNAASGNSPIISATGSGTDIDINLVPKGAGIVKGELKRFMVRLVASDTDQATGTSIGGDYRISNRAITIKAVGSYCDTAGTTGTYTVDINEAGVSILSTKITVDSTEKSSETAATPPVISDASIAADAVVTFDVDAVQTTKAKGLVVWIDYVYA